MSASVIAAWVGASTGVIGLALSGFNTWRAYGEPTRQRQLALYAELRTVLEGADAEIKKLDGLLGRGETLDIEPPTDLQRAFGEVHRIFDSMRDQNAGASFMEAAFAIQLVDLHWGRLADAQRNTFGEQETRDRRLRAAESQLRADVADAKQKVKRQIGFLNALDRGASS